MEETRESQRTRVVLVLHAHLPYVRIPGQRFPLEELWLYQNLTECYIPLLLTFRDLSTDTIHYRVTLSFSPTLIAMLSDEYYRSRYLDYLETMLRLIHKALKGSEGDTAAAIGALEERVRQVRDYYFSIGGDVIGAYRGRGGDGKINIITTCATHALLPGFRFSPELVRLQVETGLRCFEDAFGYRPRGLWLPEMGYYARLDEILRGCGIEYTFLDSHSVYRTARIPGSGNFFPCRSDAGLVIFPRDVALSGAVWSKGTGYPGDFRYREFHYDYTYSMSDSDLSGEGVDRMPFGLKVYRVTGGEKPKEFYRPGGADEAVKAHAGDFIAKIRERASVLGGIMDAPPVFTLPFDMELFGHWWYEGPDFLSLVLRGISEAGDIRLSSPEEFTGLSTLETFTPAESSWGRQGYFDTWLTSECLHIYPEIADLYGRLSAVAGNTSHRKAVQGALREIMLAQSSDWPFFIAWNNFRDYGKRRLKEHLNAAEKIIASIEEGAVDAAFIQERGESYPIFERIKYYN